MRKIACVGYHATGAGVIDDLFREFDNVAQCAYEFEFRILQDPDGISDLEYNLVENPHRLNSGYAIKRFQKYIKRMRFAYRRNFGAQWKEITDKYISNLVKIDYSGYWHGDIWLLNPFFQYYHLIRRALSRIVPKKLKKPAYFNYFPWLHTYHACMPEKEFLKNTQDYIDALCEAMNTEEKEYVLLDQPFSPGNLARYIRYVKNVKTIIVDRDPRDVYIFQKNIKEHTLPKDPHEFCTVFRDSRRRIADIPEGSCLFVTFEDMIYNYDESVRRVLSFVGLDESHHTRKKERFNPDVSIKNTRLWEKYPEYEKDIKIIEKELQEYLYVPLRENG